MNRTLDVKIFNITDPREECSMYIFRLCCSLYFYALSGRLILFDRNFDLMFFEKAKV